MTLHGSIYSRSVRYISLTEVLYSLLCSVFELVSAYGTVGLSLGIPDVGHIQFYHGFSNL